MTEYVKMLTAAKQIGISRGALLLKVNNGVLDAYVPRSVKPWIRRGNGKTCPILIHPKVVEQLVREYCTKG